MGLSTRLKQMAKAGRHLTDDSVLSERNLKQAMQGVVAHARKRLASIGGTVHHTSTISLYECQQHFHAAGGPAPNVENKTVFMKPDGGILFASVRDKTYPILIVEDKVQGTNDLLYAANQKRQATGNAIERGAKNIRGAEMLFANLPIFPYLIFAAGCDFHASETIAKRIEMMNMGFPNHYIEVTPSTTPDEELTMVEGLLPNIDVTKKLGMGIASVFVKAHKWDEMPHGSSQWKTEEYQKICCHAVDLSLEALAKTISTISGSPDT